jgi:Clathrin light chain
LIALLPPFPLIPPQKPLTTPPPSQWRQKRDADLTRRAALSASKTAETISKARRDIDDFYDSYNRKTDKQKAETARQAAEFLAKREDTTAGGTSWERIARLTDLSGKGQAGGGEGSSKKRMRELLLELKKDPNAPGAGGV